LFIGIGYDRTVAGLVRTSRGWFVVWTGVGAVLLFSILDLPGYGLLVAPIAIVAFAIALRKAPRLWPEVLGLVEGAGATCLLLAYLNRDYRPCPSGPIILGPGQSSFSCGGAPPQPWLIAGALLVTIAALAYLLALRANSNKSVPAV
jgi:hypothetical protein